MTLEEAKKECKDLIEEYLSCSVIGLDMQVDLGFGEKRCEAIDTVLKALEEQQKEIEKLKKEEEKDYTSVYLSGVYAGQDKLKDKIREKIKERESKRDNAEMDFTSALFERDVNLLQELLGDESHE